MNTPAFSTISTKLRNSALPEDLRQKLMLLFFRMAAGEQMRVLAALETSKEALPLFAELLTELEQSKIEPNDAEAIEELMERYIAKMK